MAYAWATSLNEDEAAALLRRLNLGEAVVDYAVELGAFNHAFQLAQLAAKHRQVCRKFKNCACVTCLPPALIMRH